VLQESHDGQCVSIWRSPGMGRSYWGYPRKEIVKSFESTFCRLEYVICCNFSNCSLYYVVLILISRFRFTD